MTDETQQEKDEATVRSGKRKNWDDIKREKGWQYLQTPDELLYEAHRRYSETHDEETP